MMRVSAVIVDRDWQGLGLPSGCSSDQRHVQFDFDGLWYEAMDQLAFEYAARHRGGRRIDADNLELVSFTAINLGESR